MGSSVSRSSSTEQPAPQPATPRDPTTSPAPTSTPSSSSTSPTSLSSSTTPLPRDYSFPQHKLKRRLSREGKTPLVLVACGSFSPVTVLHLQLFELAERYVEHTEFEIVGSYVSPCSDSYGKSSLVPSHHRINMCQLAIDENNSNVMIDEWEAVRKDASGRPVYTPTSEVLKRLDHQLNNVLGGFETVDGAPIKARVMLLMGADLALTMADPKIWAPADLDVLLGHYGGFVVERPDQCDIQDAIKPLREHNYNISVVPSFPNDVSSTKIRAQLRNGERALDLPESVFDYIRSHGLYQEGLLADKIPKDAPNGSSATNGDASPSDSSTNHT